MAAEKVWMRISQVLLTSNANRMKRNEPTHDEIVRLMGARNIMSEEQFVANTLALAQGRPMMLLRVREVEGIPKWFFGQVVFWRPGEPRQTNHTFSGRYCLFGLAAEGGKANKPVVSGKCMVFWPWYPGLQQKMETKSISESL